MLNYHIAKIIIFFTMSQIYEMFFGNHMAF